MSGGRVYCTYFDRNYLGRGRAMIASLRCTGESGTVLVLALDEVTRQAVTAWQVPDVRAIDLQELEDAYPQLLGVKGHRSRMEYVFTLTPWLTRYAMATDPEAAWVTYLDADLYFFSSVEPLFSEMNRYSVGIVEHRFTRAQRWRNKYGRFNVAWVAFRADESGTTCLRWWADRCLEWCFDRIEAGRFADQGYLDDFARVASGVGVVSNPGADLAPWNLGSHSVSVDRNGRPLVDGIPLVFFHFHGLRREGRRFHFKHLPYFASTTPVIRDAIYLPYCNALLEADCDSAVAPEERMERQATLWASLRRGRKALLARIGVARGDFVDI